MQTVKGTPNDAKGAARAIYNAESSQFERQFNVSFAVALSKNKELNIQHKTKSEIRKERRSYCRKEKENIQGQLKGTPV